MSATLLVGILIASACGGASGPGRSTTPPVLLSPVPTNLPLDLDLADKLAHDGDIEEAISIYTVAARQASDATQRRALWSLARIYHDQGRAADVIQLLPRFLDLRPVPQEAMWATFLLGQAQLQQGLDSEAEQSFRRYIEDGGPAASYARLRLADLLAGRGDHSAALAEMESALAEGLAPASATEARFDLARSQEATGDPAAAAATFEFLSTDAAAPFQQAEALWELAALSRRRGEDQRVQEALLSLARDYPWHPRALEALDHPQFAVDVVDRAVVLFRHRENDAAREAFLAYLTQGPDAAGQARAHYYLAILAERADDPQAALSEYEAAMADRSNPLFAEAALFRAQLLQATGRTEEAVAAYAALAAEAPTSERAAEALFQAGLLRFEQSRPGDAVAFWSRLLGAVSDPVETARARFWLARAYTATGDEAAAQQHFALAVEAAPRDYYGLRAQAIAAGEPASGQPNENPQPIDPDWPAVESWLSSWAGTEDPAAREALLAGPPWRRARELARIGLSTQAGDEFAALLEEVTGQPWLLYGFMRALLDEGQVSIAARAAHRLAAAAPEPPRHLLSVAYPSEYLDLAAQSAAQNGFSPLLLLALVRQESFFDPGAVSPADAMGLTQVIPSTAREIAGQLSEKEFQTSDLLRPRVSLRFGAHYLGSQLELLDGDLPLALAAYNGGPGNALRWQELGTDDPDILLETIDFSETQAYVQLVLENYALYRYTYGLTERPSLPLP